MLLCVRDWVFSFPFVFGTGNNYWSNRYISFPEVRSCSWTIMLANYLPLNLLKHMDLHWDFPQETYVYIICLFGLTLFSFETNECFLPFRSSPVLYTSSFTHLRAVVSLVWFWSLWLKPVYFMQQEKGITILEKMTEKETNVYTSEGST